MIIDANRRKLAKDSNIYHQAKSIKADVCLAQFLIDYNRNESEELVKSYGLDYF